jgi:uncharacterized metal-binding protein YceD (DUF177 family)
MTSELHRPVPLDRIGPDGLDFEVVANEAECAALARRMLLPSITALSCRFHLRREGHSVCVAEGHLRARILQTCIVSLEDFEVTPEEHFRLRFVPAGEESEDVDPESDDEIPYEGRSIDLGEAAAEQLALALDPYPRMPGAALPESEEEPEPHPFAALARLRGSG